MGEAVMPNTGTWIVSIAMLVLLMTGSIGTIYAQAGGQVTVQQEDSSLVKLRVHAEVLQKMLNRLLTMNLTKELELQIENLVAVNLTALGAEELREFISEAKNVLSEVRSELKEAKGNRTRVEQRVIAKLLERMRERLNVTLRRLNITAEEAEKIREELGSRIREALAGNLTFHELKHFIKNLTRRLVGYRVQNFTEQIMNYTEREAKLGRLYGLETALNASCKVLQVLERVKEKLLSVNASPVAVAAIEHAIERIASAREVLKQLVERIATMPEPKNATPGQIRKEIKSILDERLEELAEDIRENLQRLRELRSEAEEQNLTSLVESIDHAIAKLEEASSKIQTANMSFGEAMSALALAKTVIRRAEKILEEASKEHKLTKKVAEELEKVIDRLKERLNELEDKLGKLSEEFAEGMNETAANAAISRAKALIEEMTNKIDEGDVTSATKLLKKTEDAVRFVGRLIESLQRSAEQRGHEHMGRR